MKWIKTHEPKLRENYLEIHYGNLNKETQDMIAYLESKNVLMGRKESESRLIQPEEIYYCEIVDRKCYAYLKEEVWKLEEGLAKLTERYEMQGFVRISKSMVVNIFKVKQIQADFNMRMNLVLLNGETVVMSRSYRNDFFRKLKNIRMEET
ncbi:MAG: LytTR family transcriptional regulator DNA-binding domain-containing protein [Lachnospiraceae bacterium]|nr:LytTR family transcriptional regulator DNA-binding domain-containing protein [Lachnospiraceae bacterium]